MSSASRKIRFDLRSSRWERFGAILTVAATLLMLLPGGTVICIDSCGAWEITVAHEAHTCGHASQPASSTVSSDQPTSSTCHHHHHHKDAAGQRTDEHHQDEPTSKSEVEWDSAGMQHHSPCRDFESLDLPASLSGGTRHVVTNAEAIYQSPTQLHSDLPRFANVLTPILLLKPGALTTIPIPLRL